MKITVGSLSEGSVFFTLSGKRGVVLEVSGNRNDVVPAVLSGVLVSFREQGEKKRLHPDVVVEVRADDESKLDQAQRKVREAKLRYDFIPDAGRDS